MTCPLNEINADKVEEELGGYFKSLARLVKAFEKMVSQRLESGSHQRSSLQTMASDDQPFASPLKLLSTVHEEISRFKVGAS